MEDKLPGVILGDSVRPFDIRNYAIRQRYGKSLVVPGGVSIAISGDALSVLQELATAQGITPTEALRKAIATESYLHQKKTEGHTILMLGPDKEVREVIFR